MNRMQIKRLLIILVLIGILSLVALLMIKYNEIIGYECPTKKYLHIDCPGCGGTRMVQSILKGDLRQAFRFNPFLFVTLPIMVIVAIPQTIKFIASGMLYNWIDKVLIAYAVSLLAYGIIRNIEIFSWLRPTII